MAVESALIAIDGVDGIRIQSEKAISIAEERKMPIS